MFKRAVCFLLIAVCLVAPAMAADKNPKRFADEIRSDLLKKMKTSGTAKEIQKALKALSGKKYSAVIKSAKIIQKDRNFSDYGYALEAEACLRQAPGKIDKAKQAINALLQIHANNVVIQ